MLHACLHRQPTVDLLDMARPRSLLGSNDRPRLLDWLGGGHCAEVSDDDPQVILESRFRVQGLEFWGLGFKGLG